jgi:hypothetical protein
MQSKSHLNNFISGQSELVYCLSIHHNQIYLLLHTTKILINSITISSINHLIY